MLKRWALLVSGLALVIGTTRAAPGEDGVDSVFEQVLGASLPSGTTGSEFERACVDVVQRLLPDLGAADLGARQRAQLMLQGFCWRATRPGAELERRAHDARRGRVRVRRRVRPGRDPDLDAQRDRRCCELLLRLPGGVAKPVATPSTSTLPAVADIEGPRTVLLRPEIER